jgi:ribose/xylose/arabinose/galactoside ABC-type transport system permease subunit
MKSNNMLEEKTRRSFKFSDTIILLIVLAVLVLFFSLMNKQFISYDNISTMLRNMVLTGVLALGLTPLMIARGLDISFGASISFTSVVIAQLYTHGVNLWIALLIGILLATLIGLFNGLLIENFNLIPIIATLGVMAILQALALVVSDSQSVSILTDQLYFFATKSFLKIPFPIFVLVILVAVYWFILNQTKTGRVIYLVGANPRAAILSGIKTKKVRVLLYMFMGVATGIATVVIVSLTGVGMPYHGAKLALPTISAVVLGGISLAGGSGTVWGTMVGVLIVTVIFNGLSVLNVPSYYIQIFQGLALVLIVATYEIRNKVALAR